MDLPQKLAILAVVAAPLAAGCMPDSPRTSLDWDVNTRVAASRPAYAPPARTYTYDENDARPAPDAEAKSAPRSLVSSASVPSHTSVTSQPLAPIASSAPMPTSSAPIVASAAPAFAWPVSGRVVSDFGANDNGGKNDGINIAVAKDTPIHAAAAGTVTYAGDELKNYGNLVLVKHAGGYTTAYAHADRLVVKRGDAVTMGQVIGYSGQTGDVTSPQLHFEIRNNTTPVNPRSLLTSKTARN